MKVILPGTYDPVTLGHLDIIRRAAEKYDEVFVVIFCNPEKTPLFSLDDRIRMLLLATDGFPNVLVSESDGLVIDYMREHGIQRIVKGYRNEKDLAYEKAQADFNFSHGGYDTEFLETAEKYRDVSSTAVRKKLALGADASALLPPAVTEYIRTHFPDGV